MHKEVYNEAFYSPPELHADTHPFLVFPDTNLPAFYNSPVHLPWHVFGSEQIVALCKRPLGYPVLHLGKLKGKCGGIGEGGQEDQNLEVRPYLPSIGIACIIPATE